MKYGYLDKNIKAVNMQQFLRSQSDWTLLALVEDHVVPPDATMVAVHGVKRGNSKIIEQAIERNIPWVYMDNAGYYFPEMYKRITINETAPQFLREGKRFEHNVQLKPWRGGSGKNILVLPPSQTYMDTFGTRNWLNDMVNTINVYTGRDIVVRSKPAKGRFARPLQEHLDEAYCVVTWGSAIALDAIKQGIPTISTGWCPAGKASFGLPDLETIKITYEPPRMEVFDSLTWSCFTKNELNNAYNIVMENYKCNH
jgi:hypothetical protein